MIQRRDFLRVASGFGAATVLGVRTGSAEAEPPPETTRLRLGKTPAVCTAPQFVAEPLFQAEGFSDTQYVTGPGPASWGMKALAAGEIDITVNYGTNLILQVDAGDPVVILGGIHVGCYELFGGERVRAVRDLRGRKVAVPELGSSHHVFVSMMASHVGLDPRKDIEWVLHQPGESRKLLVEAKVDALMAFPPEAQELRAKKIGHVVVSSALDRPWSQYFCCMIGANADFVRKHPSATKRAVRALLKATNVCATEPERAARLLVDRDISKSYEYALQALKDLPYNRWRELDPTDAVRFWALRLHEAGLIKSGPNKIIAQGTDWRFFNELKKELKA
ncbi:MAG TPA: ABC transporter substrate-binding protein [Candidatus Acidoferrum sp.]|nr:ABC transporter substrate-binding protein [Candidatus Acidoferrum sp.]